jgi:hypothetical protein
MTLAVVGEIEMETPDELLLPQPSALSAAASTPIDKNFHQLIPSPPQGLRNS